MILWMSMLVSSPRPMLCRPFFNVLMRLVKLVRTNDLKNLDKDSYEIIPSLVVYSIKNPNKEYPTGRKKARLVACGNYQLQADKQVEGIQTGVYAGTTSTVVWRSLINIFTQGRQSVAAMDVSEAFTQTDEKSQATGGRNLKTFLRLPSQWKSKIMPTILVKAGCTIENYGSYILQILKSIYGEAFAPKRWQGCSFWRNLKTLPRLPEIVWRAVTAGVHRRWWYFVGVQRRAGSDI